MTYFFWFLLWTFIIYWCHRVGHLIPYIKNIHFAHHKFISTNPPPVWHWTNIFLFQDNWVSTFDVWITEFIPTIIFCLLTGQWWIVVIFYLWSAFIQESIEHNPSFNKYPLLTSGKWHLIHHTNGNYNYGIFLPIWDIVFKTYKPIN